MLLELTGTLYIVANLMDNKSNSLKGQLQKNSVKMKSVTKLLLRTVHFISFIPGEHYSSIIIIVV